MADVLRGRRSGFGRAGRSVALQGDTYWRPEGRRYEVPVIE